MPILVKLSHARNPDIDGGYWQQPIDDGTTVWKAVTDIPEASQVVRAYIDRNGLGSGNFTGGQVVHAIQGKHKPFARISYNGRAWDLNGKALT